MSRKGARIIVWVVATCLAGLAGLPEAMAQGCGDPEAGSCFEPNGTPFCDNGACCEAVCAEDAFCCDTEWDQICADAAAKVCPANDLCENAAGIGNGETPFTNTNAGTEAPSPCVVIGSDVFYQYTASFSGLLTISTCGSGFDTVLAVYDGCACDIVPANNCCFANGSSGCDDPECEAAVCAVDPFCCDVEWDAACVTQAADLCDIECLPQIACNDDFCGLQSQVTIAVTAGQCYTLRVGGFAGAQGDGVITISKAQANDSCVDRLPIGNGETPFSNVGATTDGPDVCGAIGSDVWFNYTADFTGELTVATCGSEFDTVVAAYDGCECELAGTSDCCAANGTPGCDDAACQEVVCAADPFCCDTEWDGICAESALELCFPLCQAPSLIACNDDGCELQSQITFIVVEGECYKLQVGGFAGAQGNGVITITKGPGCGSAAAGDCLETEETPFCNDAFCCELVCSADPFCCEVAWDGICVDEAVAFCLACGDPEAGSCFEPNGTLGCADEACCETVCAVDPFCCVAEWDAICVDNAWFLCAGCGGNEAGSCLEANGTPSCSDLSCCATVCEIDPFCCDTEWDGICADEAADFCCPGDINRDGEVNVDDLILGVILNWGPCPVGLACPADLNGNRTVDVDDLITVIVNWGPCE